MRILTKALLAVVAGAFVSASGANAANIWNCTAPANVCAKRLAKAAKAKSVKHHHHAKTAKSKHHHAKAWHKKSRKGAHKPHKRNKAASYGGGQSGIASWYGGKFHGRKTASGERYNQNALTAAHRSLPFGTRVRVTNTTNGNAVIVRINDRGPFVGGRVIDLSRAAANSIGINGLGRVKLAVLSGG
ncbi:MAG TPA: septal ring lytic transglycosylase RlpA family protein [Hyphomicrobium sp.]|nr:septal ring lytic transglycosylase RlpA family protein [Hyphomicrobium sp.]